MEQGQQVIAAWRTNNGATTYLIENLPAGLWSSTVPGLPRQTVGMIAAHISGDRGMAVDEASAGVACRQRTDAVSAFTSC
jgi:hypothetical protein